MKKLSLLLLLLLLMGCAKEEEPFKSYLRMELDGVKVECNAHIQASSYTNLSPTQLLSISGNWTQSAQENGAIEIECYNFDNKPGEKELASPSLVTVWLNHYPTSGGAPSETYHGNSTTDFKLVIAEVSERFVKGTFAGEIQMNFSPGTSKTKTISNGAFHIKR